MFQLVLPAVPPTSLAAGREFARQLHVAGALVTVDTIVNCCPQCEVPTPICRSTRCALCRASAPCWLVQNVLHGDRRNIVHRSRLPIDATRLHFTLETHFPATHVASISPHSTGPAHGSSRCLRGRQTPTAVPLEGTQTKPAAQSEITSP